MIRHLPSKKNPDPERQAIKMSMEYDGNIKSFVAIRIFVIEYFSIASWMESYHVCGFCFRLQINGVIWQYVLNICYRGLSHRHMFDNLRHPRQ